MNAFEADRQAQLIVSINEPVQVDLFENSFHLLVNTQDGTATGLSWLTLIYTIIFLLLYTDNFVTTQCDYTCMNNQ